MIESHPGKPLEVHIKGVLKKSKKNCNFPVTEVAVLFHDLGKINPNFQQKIQGQKVKGYSNHSYLSVLIFYNFILHNQKCVEKLLKVNDKAELKICIWQLLAIIAHHHGNLPNFKNLLNSMETNTAGTFIDEREIEASSFIENKIEIRHQRFSLSYDPKKINFLSRFDDTLDASLWQTNALSNFMDTQFAFASLIEADKRDAGKNEDYILDKKIEQATTNLIKQLHQKFILIDKNAVTTPLNLLRTAIRNEAINGIRAGLAKGARVFSLPAPTGAGKTFTLLAVVKEILLVDNKLGIIYALPFLSITDQVQQIVEELGIECLPISSKSQNKQLEDAQQQYEANPTQVNLEQLTKLSFSEATFDHPFVLTTFVLFFETLVSNKNSTLLKLPNFCNRIFLIDEVQALPPRLYIFFTAWLEAFCKSHNSFAILSTGTMPKFSLPDKTYTSEQMLINPALVFKNYSGNSVYEIINPKKYFNQDVFNRYRINWLGADTFSYEELIEHILNQKQSCLIILNTIADTKELFSELKEEFANVILLNTHFTAQDRINKIDTIKNYLKKSEQIIVISTQLIEAGVDVDFPIVYRDLCPLPSLIQSAGRCNRNKNYKFGQVYLFQLINKQQKKSSKLIYKKEAAQFLKFCKEEISDETFEKDLFDIQSRFFDKIKDDLTIGEFVYDTDKFGNEKCRNFLRCINKAEFEAMGSFKLILEEKFGEEYQYFIPEDNNDVRYEELIAIMQKIANATDFNEKSFYKIKMDNGLKDISKRLITARIKKEETAPAFSNSEQYFGIRVLADLSKYSPITGLELGSENCLL